MTKLNWSCTSCGVAFSRRFSVQRHIDNYNIHNGLGQAVPYAEYSRGIREGKYRPQKVPQFTWSESSFFDRGYNKIIAEVENQIVREIAKRIFDRVSANQSFLNDIEKIVSDSLVSKNLRDILEGSNS
jgi:hypothetical protein